MKELKVKDGCLDKVIYNHFSSREQMLRFVDVRLYKYLIKIYPDYFEEKIEKVKNDIPKKGKSRSKSIKLDNDSKGESDSIR